MNTFDLLAFRFVLASGGCLVAGLGVWAVMSLCRRYLPDFSRQRSLWLLAQLAVAATFLVIMLPHSERLRLVPPIELPETRDARPLAASAPAAMAGPSATAGVPVADESGRSWLVHASYGWLLTYLLGLAYALMRLLRARRLLYGLAVAGHPLPGLEQHHGFDGGLADMPAPIVIEVDGPISPMLFGLFKPRLILPRHLRGFEAIQQHLIIAHELTHLRRRDLHWMSAGLALQTLFWFNPFMWLLRAQLAWAQELGCDRDVLRGRPQAQRKAYAAALVAQLKLQHGPLMTALAFGALSANTLAGRIALIREPVSAPAGPWTRCAAVAGLASIVAASVALQPALASRIAPSVDRSPSTSIHSSPATAQPAPQAAPWSASAATAQATLSCTLLADAASGQRLVHEGTCDERVTPASTFNIVVSLMGYDSAILRDEHAPTLPFKAGYANWNPSWRTATDPTSWLGNSVVWYAQQITSRLGQARFQRYVTDFNYGNQDVSGDAGKNNGLAMSWISSSLTISPTEQVAFLRKLVNRQLPLSAHAYDMTTRIMPAETLDNGWQIHGKTGTAAVVLPDGRDDREQQYGWYVGWASKGQRTIVFARLLRDRRQEGAAGARVKQALLRDLSMRLDTL